MTVDRIGYAAGQKDFPQPNVLRILVGEATPTASGWTTDTIVLLETNLDDMTGESLGYCCTQLRLAGALDVATTPLQMKKDRPGVLVQVQCRPADAERLANLLFRETTTLGLRRSCVERLVLPRRSVTVATPWGEVAGVVARLPDGSERFSPEYEACRTLAEEHRVPLAEVESAARGAYAAR
jgi:uncharacterized protein (DUF111 family)